MVNNCTLTTSTLVGLVDLPEIEEIINYLKALPLYWAVTPSTDLARAPFPVVSESPIAATTSKSPGFRVCTTRTIMTKS